jgi:hypothetical protein
MGCDENGPAAALLVGHVSIKICSAPRALPAAHFDRSESHVIYGTGHLQVVVRGVTDRRLTPLVGLRRQDSLP